MHKVIIMLALFLSAAVAASQNPPPIAAYLSSDGTSGGTWIPLTETNGSSALGFSPPGFGLYYQGSDGNWYPCTLATCFGNSGGTGTVTSVSVTTANGVSGTVATATTTPAISLTLGAITPSSLSVSGVTALNTTTDGAIVLGSGASSSNYFSFSTGRAFIGFSGTNYVIQAPLSKTILIQTGSGTTFGSGTNSMAFDASQNVGIGSGNASATSDYVYWDTFGVKHENGPAPVVTGTGCTLANGSNAGGAITTSSATACTVTFSHSGWGTWAACTVSASLSTSLPYVSAQSITAATFTEVSSTGTLYYQCNGK